MRDLPPCRHRGSQVANNRWVCHSPGVEVLGGIASGEMCLDLCPHIDHPVSLGKLDRDMDRPGVMEGSNPNSARLELEAPVKVIVQPSQLSIAMVTVPRPISTVERSLTELRHGGFTQRVHLFSEPGSSLLCQSDVVTHQHSKRLVLGKTGSPPRKRCWTSVTHRSFSCARTISDWLGVLRTVCSLPSIISPMEIGDSSRCTRPFIT